MTDVFLLIEDESDCQTVVLGAYSTPKRARNERARLYRERDTARLIREHAAYLRDEDPDIYQFFHGKTPPEKVARYRYERIRVARVALDAPVEDQT